MREMSFAERGAAGAKMIADSVAGDEAAEWKRRAEAAEAEINRLHAAANARSEGAKALHRALVRAGHRLAFDEVGSLFSDEVADRVIADVACAGPSRATGNATLDALTAFSVADTTRITIASLARSLVDRAHTIKPEDLGRIECLLCDAINGTWEGPYSYTAASHYDDRDRES